MIRLGFGCVVEGWETGGGDQDLGEARGQAGNCRLGNSDQTPGRLAKGFDQQEAKRGFGSP